MRMLLLGVLGCFCTVLQAATITVNTATDDFGTVLTNCSLREAIQSANNNLDFGGCTHTGVYGAAITDNINLPSIAPGSFFTLTRFTGHDDANNSTDLDITGNVNINGVSASNTVIRGNVSAPDNQRERLIHVLSGTVTLNDLTLRDGKLINQAAGAGLRTEPGSTTILNNVVVGLNTADGNAGGILNRGAMTINDSAITNNRAENPADGGGGLFHSGTALTINDTVISGNAAENDGSGGGLRLIADATINNCLIENNTVEGAGDGAGVQAFTATVQITGSTVRNNTGNRGGGIACLTNTVCEIERTLISGNETTDDGGGVVSFGSLRVVDSVIDSNRAMGNFSNGGGIAVRIGSARIERSTIINNVAEQGGGILISVPTVLINSSVLNNAARAEGGGVAMFDTVDIRSSTIAANVSNDDNLGGGAGGGIYLENGLLTLANSVLAGNLAQGAAQSNECNASFVSAGFNLVQDADDCMPFQSQNDSLNVTAGLAAAANNGGVLVGSTLTTRVAMLTRAPLPNSVLLDAANPTGCTNETGAALATDQLGNPRALDGPDPDSSARCDRGAVEFVIPNSAPTLSPTKAVNRQQGTLDSFTPIAAIGDAEQPVASLVVTTTSVPSGVTVANLTNDNGTVRANLSVGCAVPIGTAPIGLQVSDGSLQTTGTFNLGVTANQAPTQGTYSTQSLPLGGAATATPTLAPQDAGSVTSVTVSASGAYTGTVSVVPATGVVTLGNAGPVGTHTLTVTATDNCGASSQRSFLLNVQGDALLKDGFEDPLVQLAGSAATSAKLAVPVDTLLQFPPLGESEPVVLQLALGEQTIQLHLRGDSIARQWRLQRGSDGGALTPWLALPPGPHLEVDFRRRADGSWQVRSIDGWPVDQAPSPGSKPPLD